MVVLRGKRVGNTNPKGLPAGFIITPGGLRHKSFLRVIRPGEAITNADGALRRRNLVSKASANVPSPRRAGRNLPAFGGWITSSSWTNAAGTPISRFAATWTVPPGPRTQSDGQLIYLFNGLEDVPSDPSSDPRYILQPVLQWGESPDGGGPNWAVASWFVDRVSGYANRTPLVSTNEGDVLTGVVSLAGQADIGFHYTCEFQGIPGTSIAAFADVELRKAVLALECHRMTQCTDYPDAPMTAMGSIQIQVGGNNISPVWTVNDQVTGCGEHTIIVNNGLPNVEVDIHY